jgi:hypothetical protein
VRRRAAIDGYPLRPIVPHDHEDRPVAIAHGELAS